MLTALAKLLKVLNSETDPGQISLAFCFAMVAGFTPFFSLHNLLVLLLVLVLRVNLSAFSLGTAAFSILAFALDPLFHQVGLAALTAEGLRGLWTTLYNQTLWRVERFNNSVVLGSLIASIVLFLPPLAYTALAAHYNNYLFVAILVYGALHVFVLPGTEYMMPVALAVWWGMAGLAVLVAGFAAYRRFFGNS